MHIYFSPESTGAPVAEVPATTPPPEAQPPAESASTETGGDSVPATPEQATATTTTEEPEEYSIQIGDKTWTESELKRQIPNLTMTQSAYDRQQAGFKNGQFMTLDQANQYVAEKLGPQQEQQQQEPYDTPEITDGMSAEQIQQVVNKAVDTAVTKKVGDPEAANALYQIQGTIHNAVNSDGSPYKGLNQVEVENKMAEMLEAGLWTKGDPASWRQASEVALQEVNITTRARHESFLSSEAGQALIKEKYGAKMIEDYTKTKEAPPTLPPGGATEAPKQEYKPGELGAMSSDDFVARMAEKAPPD